MYNAQLQHLRVFYQQFCQIAKVVDLHKYEADYNNKIKDTNLKLSNIMTDDHWGIHKPLLEQARRLSIFAYSLTFANMFKRICSGNSEIIEMSKVGAIADLALTNYKRDCNQYYIKYDPFTTIAQVELMWENVAPDILF